MSEQYTTTADTMTEIYEEVRKEETSNDMNEKQLNSDEYTETELNYYDSFDDMKLDTDLLRGVYGYGFEKPTYIQGKAIIPMASGFDIIAQSQAGTGKTGCFLIGLFQKYQNQLKKEQSIKATNGLDYTFSIILSPTRELAEQTYNVAKQISKYMNNLHIDLQMGGDKKHWDKWDRSEQVIQHIIIGTPGRIYDNIKNNKYSIDKLDNIIIDEADEMLSRGFINQMYELFKYIPYSTQVMLLSATLSPTVLELSKKITKEAVNILVKKEYLTLDNIKQYYVLLAKNQKLDCLVDLFKSITITQSIIYVNTKNTCQYICSKLQNEGFSISMISGDLDATERRNTMNDFRTGKTRVLLSTDLLSRGIDIQQVSVIINFDMPYDKETYLHRIGRSGRFGKKGLSISFVCDNEFNIISELEKFYNCQIPELPNNLSALV
jgi:translation initiation factor 4A